LSVRDICPNLPIPSKGHNVHHIKFLNMPSIAKTSKSFIDQSTKLSINALASQPATLNTITRAIWQHHRQSSSQHSNGTANGTTTTAPTKGQSGPQVTQQPKPRLPDEIRKKTMTELDEELRLKLEGISGNGGASGVEYENGQANGLKRNVKANMFRVI
jgi:hypothetical protein